MSRPPLRSKTGCLVCRGRRKKCDERKPCCGDCRRLGFECTWKLGENQSLTNLSLQKDLTELRNNSNGADRLVRRAPGLALSRPHAGNVTGNGYRAFRSQSQFDLVIQSPQHLTSLISSSAAEEFRNTSILITLALQHDWLRDALAAFSTIHLVTSTRNPSEMRQTAVDVYQLALVNMRRHIGANPSSFATIEVLTAITFLGMFESMGPGDGRLALRHFIAALKFSSCVPVPSVETPTELMLYRVAVECWLYHLATLGIYYRLPSHILKSIDWGFLDQVYGQAPGSYSPALRTSPFLGGSHLIYRIMLQVTWFARQDVPVAARHWQISKWSNELDLITGQLGSYHSALPGDVASLYYWKSILHIHAIRIFLVKIADHRSTSSTPAIRDVLAAARGILECKKLHEARNPALAWPLVVFLCASYEDSMLDFFRSIIFTIRDNFDEGHRTRLSSVLHALKQKRAAHSCSDSTDCQPEHDTLDLLLSEGGILDSQIVEISTAKVSIPES